MILSLFVIAGIMNHFVTAERTTLGFYSLPTLFSAYFYGRRHAVLTAFTSARKPVDPPAPWFSATTQVGLTRQLVTKILSGAQVDFRRRILTLPYRVHASKSLNLRVTNPDRVVSLTQR